MTCRAYKVKMMKNDEISLRPRGVGGVIMCVFRGTAYIIWVTFMRNTTGILNSTQNYKIHCIFYPNNWMRVQYLMLPHNSDFSEKRRPRGHISNWSQNMVSHGRAKCFHIFKHIVEYCWNIWPKCLKAHIRFLVGEVYQFDVGRGESLGNPKCTHCKVPQRMTSGRSDWWNIIINCALLNYLSNIEWQKMKKNGLQTYSDALAVDPIPLGRAIFPFTVGAL